MIQQPPTHPRAGGPSMLYLKHDRKLYDWETPVETDELTEAVVSTERDL